MLRACCIFLDDRILWNSYYSVILAISGLPTGLAGLPTSTLQPLQRVQNAAARLVFGLSRFEHVTPTLIHLHWLPVSYRIRFKLCCLVHAIHYGRSPAYLTETVQSVGASRSCSGLRSSSTSSMDYSLPRLRTKFGERAFSHAGLPPGTLCPTTSAPWLILSSSENCLNYSILVKLLTFDDFYVSLCALASG